MNVAGEVRSVIALRVLLACGTLVGTAADAFAQAPAESDHRVVLEIGAAAQRPASGGPTSWGASLATELTPVEHGLDLEVGVTMLGVVGEHELSADFLVMKPWQLGRAVELMVGLGPEVSWRAGTTSASAEVVGHLMVWPRHDIGLFVEPGFSIQPSRNGERSLGLTAGLLIGL